MTAFIETRQVKKVYKTPAGEFTALKGIDLQVNRGEFVAVIGKSGSGKSTLINMLAGIDRPSSGEIHVGETAVHRLSEAQMAVWRGRNLGIIFQFFQLLPTLTVIENVMLPMDLNHTLAPRHRREHAMHLLDLVEMTQQADKLPSAVSGGQQQRVAIARALANNPPLIIADEPTGNLDSKTAEKIFLLFEGLVSAGKTILMVTHDDDLAKRASRTIMISDGEVVNEQLVRALATLNQDQVVEVKRKVTPHVYPPGAVIVEQGTVGSEFFIILDGEVEVFVRQPDGANLFVDRLSSGQYFGEMALMGNGLRRGTVKANPHSEVAVAALDRVSFDHLVADSRALREEIGEQITARLAQIQARAEEEKRFHDKLREVESRLTALQIAEEGGHGGN